MYLAYTAGPYRAPSIHGVVQNIRAAETVAVALWRMGFAVLCPHLNTSLLDGCIDAEVGSPFKDAEVWLKGDLEMLRRCDLVVMLPGWRGSSGATAERSFADDEKILIFYWEDAEDMLALSNIASGATPFCKRF